MREVSDGNFGLLIAYLLPGFIVVLGISVVAEPVQSWLSTSAEDQPTIGGFLYATLASIAAGLMTSTVRWLLIDPLHHLTGIRQPKWNFSRLPDGLAAFDRLVEVHYRYYQFYSNTLVALPLAYCALRFQSGLTVDWRWLDLALLLTMVVLFLGSRDTLRKYYARTAAILADKHVRRKL